MKALFFDHDDTLVATYQAKWAQHKHIAKTFYNKELDDSAIRPHWGKPFSQMIKLLYETEDGQQAMSYNIAAGKHFPKQLFEDTLSTMDRLREQGLLLGLVTATTRSSLEDDFKTLSIPQDLFNYIQTEEKTSFHKPDPRVFAPVIEWLFAQGIAPHEALYVGDSLLDMRAAQEAGLHFIGVATGLTTIEDFSQNQVTSFKNLSELLEMGLEEILALRSSP